MIGCKYKLGDTVRFDYRDGNKSDYHVHLMGVSTGGVYLFLYDESNRYAPPVRRHSSYMVHEFMKPSKMLLIEKEKESSIPDYGIKILDTETALNICFSYLF
jgi:hypothetical protein